MSSWRPTSYTIKHSRRMSLKRFIHKSRTMRLGTDKHNAPDPGEWARRHTKMVDWATKRFGDRYTSDTRPASDDVMHSILWFCFETAEDAAEFDAFLDSPEADQRVPRWE
jgi:hypothetical protein